MACVAMERRSGRAFLLGAWAEEGATEDFSGDIAAVDDRARSLTEQTFHRVIECIGQFVRQSEGDLHSGFGWTLRGSFGRWTCHGFSMSLDDPFVSSNGC